MKSVPARYPNCGANNKVEDNMKQTEFEYCHK